jgi:acyl-CoA synthetase (NDP forming)
VYTSYLRFLQTAREASGKPVLLVAARQGSGFDPQVVEWTHAGFPVLDGVPSFLRGVRALFACRDHFATAETPPPAAPSEAVRRWKPVLAGTDALDEVSSLAMLKDFGIPVADCRAVDDLRSLDEAAATLAFPVALKTATPGILHKTEQRGVILNIGNAAELRAMYAELSGRLGPRAIVAPMIGGGVEMILGARRDPQFGPVVLIGFGGIHAELLEDAVFALPPFDVDTARRKADALRMRPLLDGTRGEPPRDAAAFCEAAARFSAMVHALREELDEFDINPLIVTAEGCIAVDALVLGRGGNTGGR